MPALVQNDVSRINKSETTQTIDTHAKLKFSYVILLMGSSIITTLGLLMDQSAAVIGGMIIAPIMWPLVKIALGISTGNDKYIKEAFYLISLSIILSLITSSMITAASPIQTLNQEIISRAHPTLLDLIIALTAGMIAALAITHPRISPNLAGVAIATSLMPPLCVAGVGFALLDLSIFSGSFLLFTANVISIVFTATIIFLLFGAGKQRKKSFTRKGLVLTSLALLIIAIPLYVFLRIQAFETTSYSKTKVYLSEELKDISPTITVDRLHVTLNQGEDEVRVEADVRIPTDVEIDFETQQKISKSLEGILEKKVQFELQLFPKITTISQNDQAAQRAKNIINEKFVSLVNEHDSQLTIDSINSYFDEDKWTINSVIHGDVAATLTENDRVRFEQQLSDAIIAPVILNLELIPRIQLQSEQAKEHREIELAVQDYFEETMSEITITTLSVHSATPPNSTVVTKTAIYMTVVTPAGTSVSQEKVAALQSELSELYDREVVFEITVSSARKLLFD